MLLKHERRTLQVIDVYEYNKSAPDCATPSCPNVAYWSGVGRLPRYCSVACREEAKAFERERDIPSCARCRIKFAVAPGQGNSRIYCGQCGPKVAAEKRKAASRRSYLAKVREQNRVASAGFSRSELIEQAMSEGNANLDSIDRCSTDSREYIEAGICLLRMAESGRYDLLWPGSVDSLLSVKAILRPSLNAEDYAALLERAVSEIDPRLAAMEASPRNADYYLAEALELAWGPYAALWDRRPTTVEDLDAVLNPESAVACGQAIGNEPWPYQDGEIVEMVEMVDGT